MAKLIESAEFRRPHDDFQNTLRNDIAHIRDSQAVFVPADKTRNLYRMRKTQYEKLLQENITRHYSELISKCRHQNKFSLLSFKGAVA